MSSEIFHAHQHSLLFCATVLSSFPALTTIPSFIPFTLHLSILLFYAPLLFGNQSKTQILGLWLALTIAKSSHWFIPSLNALSTPSTSVVLLLAHGAVTSFVSLFSVLVYTRSRTRSSVPMLFPTLWATVWWTLALLSPVGYLTSWSPLTGLSNYNWLVSIFGGPARDWLVAAWAIVISEAFEMWYMGSEKPEEAPLISSVSSAPRVGSRSRRTLVFVLLALAIPPYFSPGPSLGLPRPISATDSTPLTVGCVLPHAKGDQKLSFEDFLKETKDMAGRAHIALWPEGAVSFVNEKDREKSLEKLKDGIPNGRDLRVGVSFEESYVDPSGRSMSRTGLALVSRFNVTEMIYYKRNLVPSR